MSNVKSAAAVAKKIELIIERAGLTQSDFKDIASQGTVWAWIQGSEPGALKLALVAERCGVTPNDVLLDLPEVAAVQVANRIEGALSQFTLEDLHEIQGAIHDLAYMTAVNRSELRPAAIVAASIRGTAEKFREKYGAGKGSGAGKIARKLAGGKLRATPAANAEKKSAEGESGYGERTV